MLYHWYFFSLILSLQDHTKLMKLNMTACIDPNTEACHENCNFVSLLFLFFVFLLLGGTFNYLIKLELKLVVVFGETIAILNPCSHSHILTWGKNEL